ncbi:hypothetical protein [Gelidibacter salicanalis]|uniref:DUF4097 domain-containing protein n=1 Tax=Gelidibacter salicanalis TaxID=291193 RepID=A0A934KK66_9FLAO|nr:hypothetical protein [Gelidibacter salicanalis]MBJ7879274.1 hypothetical protein [Gelidibacter salicanalis]
MKHIKLIALLILVLNTVNGSGQEKLQKLSKNVKANKEVIINLNTSHVNIEIDTWNKPEVEVVAFIEGEKLSKEELQKALKNWNIDISGSGDEVTITSKGGTHSWPIDFDTSAFDVLRNFEWEMAELPQLPEMPEMPELPNLPKMPKLPELPKLPDGIGTVIFDYEAYKKDGEAYLEKWSKTYEENYGKAYKEKMKGWAREFGKTDFSTYSKNMEKWGEAYGKQFGKDYEKKMEAWGKNFEEKWGKDFGQKWAEWGEKFGEAYGKRMEDQAKIMQEHSKSMQEDVEKMQVETEARQEMQQHRQGQLKDRQEVLEKRKAVIVKSIESKAGTKVKRTIQIKMPKKAQLKLNVRHGELKLSSVITNLKADISHAALTAEHIDGRQTSINVSYSPVLINQWSLGELNLNYVDKAQIEHINRMVLSANSSNISMNTISGNAIIEGSFGTLEINKIADTFTNLNISLENSDALLVLPKTDFNLYYKGSRSKLKHPKNKNATISSFSTGDVASGKSIVVNAKFSEVIMQ